MKVALSGTAAAAVAAVVLTLLLRDPDDAYAVPTVVVGLGVLAAALSARLLLPARRGRGSAARAQRALRRGLAIGATVGLLAALRVVDGLTPITAAFVIGGFAAAEVALTARAS